MEKISQRWANFARITLWRAKDALDSIVITPCALVRVCLLLLLRQGGQVRWSGQVRFGDRGDRENPKSQTSSIPQFVCRTYLRKFCISSLGQVGFYNSQFYKIFCHSRDSFGQIISNKTTNYKFQKNQRYFKIYFKYIFETFEKA